jgi:transposase-like protein
MEGRQRRSFTDDYKRQAVDLVASSGRSIGSVANARKLVYLKALEVIEPVALKVENLRAEHLADMGAAAVEDVSVHDRAPP